MRNLIIIRLLVAYMALVFGFPPALSGDSFPAGQDDMRSPYGPHESINTSSEQTGSNPGDIEIAYDDGVPEYVYWRTSANSSYSVRFTPPTYPVMLKTAKVYIPASGDDPYVPFAIRVLDDVRDETEIPDTTISAQSVPEWVEVDLSRYKFTINDGDFYISMVWLEADNPRLGGDATPPIDGRSYSGALFSEVEDDLMIRAVVTDIVPPSSLFAQSNHDGQVPLSWLDPGSANIPTRSSSQYSRGQIIVRVTESQPQGYNIYRRTGIGQEFAQIAYTTSSRYVDRTVENGTTYYYAVTSVYSDGESVFSEEASAMPDSGHVPVLFVDDDGTWYSSGTLWGLHQLLENSLYRTSIPYVYWEHVASGAPPLDTLNQYSKVVWTTSIEGVNMDGTSLSTDDIDNLERYLSFGGKLFITGMDIASEISGSTLFSNYFSATFVSDDAGEGYAGGITGVAGDPISAGMALQWGPGDGFWFSDAEFPDVVDPANDSAKVIFTYTNKGTNAGLRKATSTYSVVYLPWNFETIDGGSNRDLLTERIMDWLDTTAVDSSSPLITYGPNVTDTRGDHLLLEWSTDELSRTVFLYGDTIPYSASVESNLFTLDHAIDLEGLQREHTYHYAIRSIDRSGNVSQTDDSTFTTLNDAPIVSDIPDMVFTENQTVSINLSSYVSDDDFPYDEITWSYHSGDSLLVEIGDGTAEVTNVPGFTGVDSVVFVATDLSAASDSDWVHFEVLIAPPVAPTLVSPDNGAVDVFTSPTLIWSSSRTAASYHLQVSDTESFSTLTFEDSTLTDTIYQVTALANSNVYFWRVRAKNEGGASPWSDAYQFTTGALDVSSAIGRIPREYSLSQNYPNPFNAVTTFHYGLPEGSHVSIKIYDVTGKPVTTLVDDVQEPGFKSVIWRGINTQGRPVSTGVYLYQIKARDFTQVRKMLLLK